MDWDRAIERNRQPLLRIVASLFAMIGLSEDGQVERLARPLYRAVLLVLRPAEAAVRRLIIVAARGMVVKPSPKRSAPAGLRIAGKGGARLSFRLFDPRKRFAMAPGPPEARPAAAAPHPFPGRGFRCQVPLVQRAGPGCAIVPAAATGGAGGAGGARSAGARSSEAGRHRQCKASVPPSCRHQARARRSAAPGQALGALAGTARRGAAAAALDTDAPGSAAGSPQAADA